MLIPVDKYQECDGKMDRRTHLLKQYRALHQGNVDARYKRLVTMIMSLGGHVECSFACEFCNYKIEHLI